jgi:hypothetical protein
LLHRLSSAACGVALPLLVNLVMHVCTQNRQSGRVAEDAYGQAYLFTVLQGIATGGLDTLTAILLADYMARSEHVRMAS